MKNLKKTKMIAIFIFLLVVSSVVAIVVLMFVIKTDKYITVNLEASNYHSTEFTGNQDLYRTLSDDNRINFMFNGHLYSAKVLSVKFEHGSTIIKVSETGMGLLKGMVVPCKILVSSEPLINTLV